MIGTGFQERTYREKVTPPVGLTSFRVIEEQTDLWIAARKDLTGKARRSVKGHRKVLKSYIERHPGFGASMIPLEAGVDAGGMVVEMLKAAKAVGTGPMAAVAGAIAESVARDLSQFSDTVIVENGGDLYLIGDGFRTIGIWAGDSPLSGQVGLKVEPGEGLSVCTSSGTVGPSKSFGRADAALVVSESGALADAAATALGNMINTSDDIEEAINEILKVDGVSGAVALVADAIGAAGNVELASIDSGTGP